MKESYNKSVPSVSYNTAMDMLARKLEIHSGASGKDAIRAFDEALVHARDAAHASVYSKLLATCGRSTALQVSEDIAQSVAVRLFDGRVRARIASNLPKLKTAGDRRRWFGKVIYFTSCTAMRDGMRGPRFVSLDERDENGAWKLADFVDAISHSTLLPSQSVATREALEGMLAELAAKWQSTKSSRKVAGWSPADEIIGLADVSDRPSKEVIAKRTRERRQEEAGDIANRWRKRFEDPDMNGPSL